MRPCPVESSPARRSASGHSSSRSMTSRTRRRRSARPRPSTPPAVRRLPRRHQVVVHGHAGEEGQALEGAGDAGPAPAVRRPARDVVRRRRRTLPVRGVLQAGQDVEHRRLAGAVRPDEADDAPRRHAQRDVGQRAAHRTAPRPLGRQIAGTAAADASTPTSGVGDAPRPASPVTAVSSSMAGHRSAGGGAGRRSSTARPPTEGAPPAPARRGQQGRSTPSTWRVWRWARAMVPSGSWASPMTPRAMVSGMQLGHLGRDARDLRDGVDGAGDGGAR